MTRQNEIHKSILELSRIPAVQAYISLTSALHEIRPTPYADPDNAIGYALTCNDDLELRQFLQDWSHGEYDDDYKQFCRATALKAYENASNLVSKNA